MEKKATSTAKLVITERITPTPIDGVWPAPNAGGQAWKIRLQSRLALPMSPKFICHQPRPLCVCVCAVVGTKKKKERKEKQKKREENGTAHRDGTPLAAVAGR